MATSTFGRKQVVRRRRNRKAGKVKDFFCIVPARPKPCIYLISTDILFSNITPFSSQQQQPHFLR